MRASNGWDGMENGHCTQLKASTPDIFRDSNFRSVWSSQVVSNVWSCTHWYDIRRGLLLDVYFFAWSSDFVTDVVFQSYHDYILRCLKIANDFELRYTTNDSELFTIPYSSLWLVAFGNGVYEAWITCARDFATFVIIDTVVTDCDEIYQWSVTWRTFQEHAMTFFQSSELIRNPDTFIDLRSTRRISPWLDRTRNQWCVVIFWRFSIIDWYWYRNDS